jgi:hypothetical protein
MEVAVGEILSNTHVHAYSSRVGPVFVDVFQLQRTVSVVVIDMGDAVVAPVVPRKLPSYTRRGGRGLYLANRLSDEMECTVNRVGHGLTVRVTKWFADARCGGIGPMPHTRSGASWSATNRADVRGQQSFANQYPRRGKDTLAVPLRRQGLLT